MIKKILLLVFGIPFFFATTAGTIFAVMFYFTFDQASTEEVHQIISEAQNIAQEELKEYKSQSEKLRFELDQAIKSVKRGELVSDSLNSELTFRTLEVSTLKKYLEESNKQDLADNLKKTSMKELAKTFDTMKPDEFKAILANVDDNTLIALYKNMSSRNRKNIFIALSNDRAAHITQLLAGFMD